MNEHQKLVNHTPYLYYFCPISHLSSILEKGILSRNEINQKNLLFEDWSDSAVQEYRSKTKAQLSNGNVDSIHNLVCTFFSPYNTTIYKGQENLGAEYKSLSVVIKIDVNLLFLNNQNLAFAFADKNAAKRGETVNFYNNLDDLTKLDWEVLNGGYWEGDEFRGEDFNKWRDTKSAEFLIQKKISPISIKGILAFNDETRIKLNDQTEMLVETREDLGLYSANV
jgi:hypothetical protein